MVDATNQVSNLKIKNVILQFVELEVETDQKFSFQMNVKSSLLKFEF